MLVTLIGYRGSGKSCVADELAKRLDWKSIDADAKIEKRAKKTIAQIFSDDGEEHFRQCERQVISDLLSRDKLVISTGGGAILNADTRHDMQTAGPVVWLQANVDVLEKRICADESTAQRRPNLTATGGRQEIEQLLTQREPFYRECASIVIDTSRLSVGEVVDAVFDEIRPAVHKEY